MSNFRHYVRRRQRDSRWSLIKRARLGGITLVLGAGVSMSRGLPSWGALVEQVWQRIWPDDPAPEWLRLGQAGPHPLALQIVLEELEGALRAELAKSAPDHMAGVTQRMVDRELAGMIGDVLYDSRHPARGRDTLTVLVDVLRREQQREPRRIERVISFNVDDVMEREANKNSSKTGHVLWPVARASFHPRRSSRVGGPPPINVYHLHGFVTRSRTFTQNAPDTLVFTDAQYWDSVANPASFASRVMGMALQDSRCVFIGMSMTDVNLMRWLGLRNVEFLADRVSRYEEIGKPTGRAEMDAREALERHYWVSAKSDDPDSFVASHLERRGVQTVVLESWGEPFDVLMQDCFGDLGGAVA